MSEVLCEICFNAFNENDKIPKVLECGHTLCSFCLLKIFQSRKTCPSCSHPMTKSSPGEFLTNYFVLALTNNGKAMKEDSHKDSILARKEKIQQTLKQSMSLLKLVSSDLEKFPNQLRCDSDVRLEVADEVVLQRENTLQEALKALKLKQRKHIGSELFLKDFFDTHQLLYQISILCHQGGKVFAKHMVNGVPKYGKVIFKEGSILVYSLSLSEVDKNSTIVLFSDLQTCINGRGMKKFELFVEFSDEWTHSFTPMRSNLLPSFMRLLTGEAGATLKGATFEKGEDCVAIEGYLLNGVPSRGTLEYVLYLPEGTNERFSDDDFDDETFSDRFLLIGTEEGTLTLQKNSESVYAGNVIGTRNSFSLDKIPDLGSVVDCGLRLKL